MTDRFVFVLVTDEGDLYTHGYDGNELVTSVFVYEEHARQAAQMCGLQVRAFTRPRLAGLLAALSSITHVAVYAEDEFLSRTGEFPKEDIIEANRA